MTKLALDGRIDAPPPIASQQRTETNAAVAMMFVV
jgi:hypothetical protein